MIKRSKIVKREFIANAVLPVRYFDRSFNPQFTQRFFKPPCPHCSGIGLKEIEIQGNLKNNLCPKCRAEINIRLAGAVHERGANQGAFEKAA
jgi:hypothetical protein